MRWIFFVLLGANALLLSWQLFAEQPRQQAPAPRATNQQEISDSPSIALLQEVPRQRASAESPSPAAKESEVSGSQPDTMGKSMCTFVGPFEDEGSAGELVERLAAMEVQGSVAPVDIPAGPGYWVYLEPLGSKREALRALAELQAQRIDSYIIPKGELANGISLGMFSKEHLAKARLAEMHELGIDAKVDIIERSHHEIWVSIPASSAEQLGDQVWQRLLEGVKTAERRQNFCLHVASQDNFH